MTNSAGRFSAARCSVAPPVADVCAEEPLSISRRPRGADATFGVAARLKCHGPSPSRTFLPPCHRVTWTPGPLIVVVENAASSNGNHMRPRIAQIGMFRGLKREGLRLQCFRFFPLRKAGAVVVIPRPRASLTVSHGCFRPFHFASRGQRSRWTRHSGLHRLAGVRGSCFSGQHHRARCARLMSAARTRSSGRFRSPSSRSRTSRSGLVECGDGLGRTGWRWE